MAEFLHAGALAATAVSTCCVAGSGGRIRVRELALAVVMLAAMADAVLGWGLVAPVGWAAVLMATALVSVAARGRAGRYAVNRRASAMDALGAILMAVLLLLMSGGAAGTGEHGGHGVSASVLVWGVGLAIAAFATASVVMAVRMRMPPSAGPRHAGVLRRTAPLAMAASVVLMAAVALL